MMCRILTKWRHGAQRYPKGAIMDVPASLVPGLEVEGIVARLEEPMLTNLVRATRGNPLTNMPAGSRLIVKLPDE